MPIYPKRIDIRVANLNHQESLAGGAITPGDLIMKNSDDEVVVHGTADGHAAKTFALANSMAGEGIDDAYADGDTVQYFNPQPGDFVWARLAISQTIVIGDRLVSAGNGQLRKVHATPATSLTVIGIAREAVTTDGSTISRIRVEII